MTPGRAAGALVAAALIGGCAKHRERLPVTCVGDCGLTPGLGAGVPSPGGEAGADGGGGSDAGSSSGVELTGQVLVLNDDLNFTTGTVFTDGVGLKTLGKDGRDVSGAWDGSDPFSLAGVQSAPLVWVLATPDNPVADDVSPVLEPVATDVPDAQGRVDVKLAVVHSTTIQRIFDLASVPLTPDDSKAQLVLRLVDDSTNASDPPPLAGVSVKAPAAEDVLYGASGGFSDVVTETDNTGVVVLLNVAAAAWRGAEISVAFSGKRTSGAQVRAVSGAVTVATLVP